MLVRDNLSFCSTLSLVGQSVALTMYVQTMVSS